jgi:hypothetical protein
MSDEKAEAVRLLAGLENGTLTAFDGFLIAERLDPVLVYFVVRYLRESYPASDPAATAVLQRVVELTSSHKSLIARCKEGERDPVTEWFEEVHSFGEFRGRGAELLGLIADKLDS